MLMPHLASVALEMRLCWHVLDLFTFCCQMAMVDRGGGEAEGFSVGLGLLVLCSGVSAINPSLEVRYPCDFHNQRMGR